MIEINRMTPIFQFCECFHPMVVYLTVKYGTSMVNTSVSFYIKHDMWYHTKNEGATRLLDGHEL